MRTEEQWSSAQTVEELLVAGYGAVEGRKLLLLAVGWIRNAGLRPSHYCREVVDLAEACADGVAPDPTWFEALGRQFGDRLNWPDWVNGVLNSNIDWWMYSVLRWGEALGLLFSVVDDMTHDRPVRAPWRATLQRLHQGLIARRTREGVPEATAACADPNHPWHRLVQTVPQEIATRLGRDHLALARCVLGNPFHSVTCSPAWRTDTVLALARTIYESRDFSAMPILADALQDAGCDNDDVLTHCRDTSLMHARGCWVVDLVSGKG